mgnify:CR=1 FL=1
MMNYKKMTFEDAIKTIDTYDWAIVYQASEMLFDHVDEIKQKINWNECLEARFFNETSQLHVFGELGDLKAVCMMDDGKSAQEIDRKYVLANQFRDKGKYIKIKEYYDFDEDGQLCMKAIRPVKVE